MKIKDIFEIKPEYPAGHEPGLVVILDGLIAKDPTDLVGRVVTVRIPTGEMRKLSIDEAKEHGLVNSLFFRRLTLKDIPMDCEITVAEQPASESMKPSRSIAS